MSRPIQIGDLVSIVDADSAFLYPITEIGNPLIFSTPTGFGKINVEANPPYILGWENHQHTLEFIVKELGGVVTLEKFDANSATSDFQTLKRFLQDPEVMKHVRDGKIWSDEKIRKYLSYFSTGTENSEFMDRKILYSGQLVGIIGIRRDFDRLGPNFLGWPFDWIVIDRRFWKKGIGKAALKMILELYTTTYPEYSRVLSLIATDNVSSLKIHMNSGFAKYLETTMDGHPYQILVYSKSA